MAAGATARGIAGNSDTAASSIRLEQAPGWPRELPNTADLLREVNLPVTGQCFLEIFAGHAALTVCMMFCMVPVIRPWDCKYGEEFNCIDNGWVLFLLVVLGQMSSTHAGTPCQSVTQARKVPIRSFEWPRGLPVVSAWQRELLDTGNSLIEWSALFLCHCDRHDVYASMENPWPSFLWIQPCVRSLWWSIGWRLVVYSNVPFGACYQKLTGMLHNTPTLQGLQQQVDGTVETVPLSGMVWFEGCWQYRTKIAEPYVPDMAMTYAELMVQALDLRQRALE